MQKNTAQTKVHKRRPIGDLTQETLQDCVKKEKGSFFKRWAGQKTIENVAKSDFNYGTKIVVLHVLDKN